MLEDFTTDAWAVIEQAKTLARGTPDGILRPAHLLLSLTLLQADLLTSLEPEVDGAHFDALRTEAATLAAATSQHDALRRSALPAPLIASWRRLRLQFPTADPATVTPLHVLLGLLRWPDPAMDALLLACATNQEHVAAVVERRLIGLRPADLPAPANDSPTHGETGDTAVGTPSGDEQAFARDVRELLRYGDNLTAIAREGRLRSVVGREETTVQLVECLLRLDKKNVALVGPPGVGKTALVEDLAVRIVQNRVPAALRDTVVFSLDLVRLLAGAGTYGEIEQRVQRVSDILRRAGGRLILFVDEMHALSSLRLAGSLDMATVLKPLLARGDLRCIGATTRQEYAKSIEQDRALARRFTAVSVEEPSATQTETIVQAVIPRYEAHYGLSYLPESVHAVVELAGRYLPNRTFPDKALEVLDQAGATVRAHTVEGDQVPAVTRHDVAQVIARLARVPVSEELDTQAATVQDLSAVLSANVVGQEHAVRDVAQIVLLSFGRYRDQRRPRGVLLFVGPSGVGKTLLAKNLALALFHDEQALLQLNMAEYAGSGGDYADATAMLIGVPPGLVGAEKGGRLTNFVLERPFSVVLLDEIEKCGRETQNLLLHIFEEGWIEDRLSQIVSFRDVYFVLTSNAALDELRHRAIGFERGAVPADAPDEATARAVLRRQAFSPEFVSRIDKVIFFSPLDEQARRQIVRLHLERLKAEIAEKDRKLLTYTDDVVEDLCNAFGADADGRSLERSTRKLVLDAMLSARTEDPAAWPEVTEIAICHDGNAAPVQVAIHRPVARILVIDDRPAYCEELRRQFPDYHWHYRATLQDAAERPLAPPPQLIAVELTREDEGAPSAGAPDLESVRGRYPRAAIILLAGKDPATRAAMDGLLTGLLPPLLERERLEIERARDQHLLKHVQAELKLHREAQRLLLQLQYQ